MIASIAMAALKARARVSGWTIGPGSGQRCKNPAERAKGGENVMKNSDDL